MQPTDFYTGNPLNIADLDPGVQKIVSKLMNMGAVPIASCDGHGKPSRWYVLFGATPAVAQAVVDVGWLGVALVKDKPGVYRLSTRSYAAVKEWLAHA